MIYSLLFNKIYRNKTFFSEPYMDEYLINDKIYVDVEGVSSLLGKTVGSIRNMTNTKDFPEGIKKGRKLYFIKEEIEKYKSDTEIIKIKNINY